MMDCLIENNISMEQLSKLDQTVAIELLRTCQIDYITDTTPEKIGKYTPGSHIPIIDYKLFMKKNPI